MIRHLLKRSGVHFFGLTAAKVISIIVFVWLARIFDPSVFGQAVLFATILSLTTILATFGLNHWYQKESALKSQKTLFAQLFQARMVTLFISWVLVAIFLFVTKSFPVTISVLLLATLIPEALLSICEGYYLEKRQPFFLALSYPAKSLPLLIGLIMGYKYLNIDWAIFLFFLGSMLTSFLVFPWSEVKLAKENFSITQVIQNLKKASSYALLITTSFAYARGDSLIINYSISNAALGFYGAAYRYLETANLLPTALASNLFRDSSAQNSIPKNNLLKIVLIMVFVGLLAASFLYIAAPFLTILLLGPDYAPALPLLRIFSLVLFLFFINAPLSTVIQSSRLLRNFLPFGIANTIANLILNLIFVPVIGLSAAAWIMVITELTGLGINLYFVKELYRRHVS